MKKNILIMYLYLFIVHSYGQLPAPINNPSWNPTPVFFDDFTGSTINSSYWHVANNDNHHGYGEKQCYTNRSDNVFLSNGSAGTSSYLTLRLKRETYTCPTGCYDAAGNPDTNLIVDYTSGWIHLKEQSTFVPRYGYIEARISVPYQVGERLWPAFWTHVIPGSGTPPDSFSSVGEIDIMEQIAGDTCWSCENQNPQDDKMLGAGIYFHYGIYPNTPSQVYTSYEQGTLPYSYANSYHTYAVKWSPTAIVWYFDGYPVRTFKNLPFIAETPNGNPGGYHYNGGGIHEKINLILNLAYYGSSSTLTKDMQIDYVKIYQQYADPGCTTVVSGLNYNFTGYDNKVKKSITIGGTGANINTNGTITFPSNPNLSIVAAESVELGAGFNTPSNATIFIDVPGCPQ